MAAAVVTVGVAIVGGVTALAYARNPDQPGLPSERQDLLDGLTVASLGWLTCLGLLAYASTRQAARAPAPARRMPSMTLLLAAVGLGLAGSVAELAGQTAATDRLSLVLWSDTFYIVGAVCLAWTLAVVVQCGVLGPDQDVGALHPSGPHPRAASGPSAPRR
jgi:hypothetical protein